MGFELDGVLKGVLYNTDGTVDYVFDDVKFNEVIAPFVNDDDTERGRNEMMFLSSSKDCEISFESANINEDVLYLMGAIHWYDWWVGDSVRYIIIEKCPFCGQRAQVVNLANGYAYFVECTNEDCGVSMLPFPTEQEAVEAWNRRLT